MLCVIFFFELIFSLCFNFCLDDEKAEGKGMNVKIFLLGFVFHFCFIVPEFLLLYQRFSHNTIT